MTFRYWEKPTIKSGSIRFIVYLLLGIPFAFIGFWLWILTLGWASPGKFISDLAYWAANGDWPK